MASPVKPPDGKVTQTITFRGTLSRPATGCFSKWAPFYWVLMKEGNETVLKYWQSEKNWTKVAPMGSFPVERLSFTAPPPKSKAKDKLHLLFDESPLELKAPNPIEKERWVKALQQAMKRDNLLSTPATSRQSTLGFHGSPMFHEDTEAEAPEVTHSTYSITLDVPHPATPPRRPASAPASPSFPPELDRLFEGLLERGLYKQEAKEKMRQLPPAQKFMLIQQESIRKQEDLRNKDHSPAFFAKLLTGQAGSASDSTAPLQRAGSGGVAPGSAHKLPQGQGAGDEAHPQRPQVALKDVQELHVVLRGALKDWLKGFVQEGALTALLALLSPDQRPEMVSVVLDCLRAFMNNEFGLSTIVETPAAIDVIALVLTFARDAERVQVLELLTVLCWLSEEALDSVAQALNAAQFGRRYQVIMDMLTKGDNPQLKNKALTFCNVLINAQDALDSRVSVRQEFLDLGILEALERLCIWMDSKRDLDLLHDEIGQLQAQVELFTEMHGRDRRDALYKDYDLSSPEGVMQYVLKASAMDGTGAELLAALQHLAAIPADKEVAFRTWSAINAVLEEAIIPKIAHQGHEHEHAAEGEAEPGQGQEQGQQADGEGEGEGEGEGAKERAASAQLTIEALKLLLHQKEEAAEQQRKSELEKARDQLEQQRGELHDLTVREASLRDQLGKLQAAAQEHKEALVKEKRRHEEEREADRAQVATLTSSLAEVRAQHAQASERIKQLEEDVQRAEERVKEAEAKAASAASAAAAGAAAVPDAPPLDIPVAPPFDAPPMDVPMAPPMDIPMAPPFDAPPMDGVPMAPPLDGVPMAPPMDGIPMAPPMDGIPMR